MDQFIATIMPFAFNYAPVGWQQCAGQILPIAQNQALFSLLGTYYGGNGTQNFALPDLRGRAVVCQTGFGVMPPGVTNHSIGQPYGAEKVTMLATNLPLHTHAATASAGTTVTPSATLNAVASSANTITNPTGALLAGSKTATVAQFAPAGTTTAAMAQGAITITPGTTGTPTVTVNPTGSSTPIPVLQPYLAVTYCIAMTGYFPSRN